MPNETSMSHIWFSFVFPQAVSVIWYLRNVIESNWASYFTFSITKYIWLQKCNYNNYKYLKVSNWLQLITMTNYDYPSLPLTQFGLRFTAVPFSPPNLNPIEINHSTISNLMKLCCTSAMFHLRWTTYHLQTKLVFKTKTEYCTWFQYATFHHGIQYFITVWPRFIRIFILEIIKDSKKKKRANYSALTNSSKT